MGIAVEGLSATAPLCLQQPVSQHLFLIYQTVRPILTMSACKVKSSTHLSFHSPNIPGIQANSHPCELCVCCQYETCLFLCLSGGSHACRNVLDKVNSGPSCASSASSHHVLSDPIAPFGSWPRAQLSCRTKRCNRITCQPIPGKRQW